MNGTLSQFAVEPARPLSLSTSPVEVPRKQLGWESIVASFEADILQVVQLLTELRAEHCTHHWRQLLPASGRIGANEIEELLCREQTHRPTAFYWFYGRRADGTHELFGAATLADRIRADFPHDGFPVVARSFVRPMFRGHHLYRILLRHRLDECARRWGPSLKAVHFGSVRAPQGDSSLPLRFVHVGDEYLAQPGGGCRVPDFLGFTPQFSAQLRRGAAELHARFRCTPSRRIVEHTSTMLQSGLGSTGYGRLLDALEALGVDTDAAIGPAWRQFLDFCQAIPLIRTFA